MLAGKTHTSMARFKSALVVLGIDENDVRGGDKKNTKPAANLARLKFLGDPQASE